MIRIHFIAHISFALGVGAERQPMPGASRGGAQRRRAVWRPLEAAPLRSPRLDSI